MQCDKEQTINLKQKIMKIKGIKSVVSEFNNIYFGNFARIFFDLNKYEVYMLEYVDYASGPASLQNNVYEIAHIARRNGKITMKDVQSYINNCERL